MCIRDSLITNGAPDTARFLIVNGGLVLPGFLLLVKARYCPVTFINRGPDCLVSFIDWGRYCPVSYYQCRPGIARFLITNRDPVLPGFLELMKAKNHPVSFYQQRPGTALFLYCEWRPGTGFLSLKEA